MTKLASAFLLPSLVTLITLSACTPYYNQSMRSYGQNRPSFHCNPDAIQRARFVVVNMSRVPIGGHKIQVVGTLGHPQKVESFVLQDNSVVEALFYRTGEPGCFGMPTDTRFTPFIFQNGVLIGYGDEYFKAFLLPSLKSAATPRHRYQSQEDINMQNNVGAAIGYGDPVWK